MEKNSRRVEPTAYHFIGKYGAHSIHLGPPSNRKLSSISDNAPYMSNTPCGVEPTDYVVHPGGRPVVTSFLFQSISVQVNLSARSVARAVSQVHRNASRQEGGCGARRCVNETNRRTPRTAFTFFRMEPKSWDHGPIRNWKAASSPMHDWESGFRC